MQQDFKFNLRGNKAKEAGMVLAKTEQLKQFLSVDLNDSPNKWISGFFVQQKPAFVFSFSINSWINY